MKHIFCFNSLSFRGREGLYFKYTKNDNDMLLRNVDNFPAWPTNYAIDLINRRIYVENVIDVFGIPVI